MSNIFYWSAGCVYSAAGRCVMDDVTLEQATVIATEEGGVIRKGLPLNVAIGVAKTRERLAGMTISTPIPPD